jgi:hypothetical protein
VHRVRRRKSIKAFTGVRLWYQPTLRYLQGDSIVLALFGCMFL